MDTDTQETIAKIRLAQFRNDEPIVSEVKPKKIYQVSPRGHKQHQKTITELLCPNCGEKIIRDDLCPSILARRKRIYCTKACWNEYQRTHPRWKF